MQRFYVKYFSFGVIHNYVLLVAGGDFALSCCRYLPVLMVVAGHIVTVVWMCLLQSVIPAAVHRYKTATKGREVQVTIDKEYYLIPDM